MRIAKWGNSLAVRLPSSVVKILNLRVGDDVEIVVTAPRTFEIRRQNQLCDYFAALEALPKLPADFVFSRDKANSR